MAEDTIGQWDQKSLLSKLLQKYMSQECCETDKIDLTKSQNSVLRRIFWIILGINLVMFLTEAVAGYIAHSSALWADSLDMLSDVFVYALSLLVLSSGHQARVKASLVKGILMLLLGIFVVGEAIYKIINPIQPIAETISLIGTIALVANVICLILLMRHKNTDLNIKSSWICSRNDVFANAGVIIAGFLVGYFSSMWPDIIISSIIAFVVLGSARGVIKESLQHLKNSVKI